MQLAHGVAADASTVRETFKNTLLATNLDPDTSQTPRYTPNSFHLIQTEASLMKAATALSGHAILGVDLESSQESYNGFTCLLQISAYGDDGARVETYVIDVL